MTTTRESSVDQPDRSMSAISTMPLDLPTSTFLSRSLPINLPSKHSRRTPSSSLLLNIITIPLTFKTHPRSLRPPSRQRHLHHHHRHHPNHLSLILFRIEPLALSLTNADVLVRLAGLPLSSPRPPNRIHRRPTQLERPLALSLHRHPLLL